MMEDFDTGRSRRRIDQLPVALRAAAGAALHDLFWPGLRWTRSRMPISATCASGAITTAVVFVLGFTTVFTLLGATASAMGQLCAVHGCVRHRAGVVIIIMGLHFLGAFRICPALSRSALPGGLECPPLGRLCDGARLRLRLDALHRPDPRRHSRRGGDGSEACARGAFLLMILFAGLGIPSHPRRFSAMRPFVNFLKRMKSRFGMVEKVMGGLLVLTGIAFLTGGIEMMAFWMLETFPVLGRLG